MMEVLDPKNLDVKQIQSYYYEAKAFKNGLELEAKSSIYS